MLKKLITISMKLTLLLMILGSFHDYRVVNYEKKSLQIFSITNLSKAISFKDYIIKNIKSKNNDNLITKKDTAQHLNKKEINIFLLNHIIFDKKLISAEYNRIRFSTGSLFNKNWLKDTLFCINKTILNTFRFNNFLRNCTDYSKSNSDRLHITYGVIPPPFYKI